MFILTKRFTDGYSMYFIHCEPNELAGLSLWLSSNELFYFENTFNILISFMCIWVGGKVSKRTVDECMHM